MRDPPGTALVGDVMNNRLKIIDAIVMNGEYSDIWGIRFLFNKPQKWLINRHFYHQLHRSECSLFRKIIISQLSCNLIQITSLKVKKALEKYLLIALPRL